MSGYPPFMGSNNNAILTKISHGKFSFKSVEWKHSPQELKDFVKRMLTYNPDARPSLKECLIDPWLTQCCKQSGYGYYIAVDCFNNLRVFAVSSLAHFLVGTQTAERDLDLRLLPRRAQDALRQG